MIGGKSVISLREIQKILRMCDEKITSMINSQSISYHSSMLTDFDDLEDLNIARSDVSRRFPERFYYFQSLEFGCEIRFDCRKEDYFLRCRGFTPRNIDVRNKEQYKLWRVQNGVIDFGSFDNLNDCIHAFYDSCKYLIETKMPGQIALF